jgi:glucose/arabinose dehydrogenase
VRVPSLLLLGLATAAIAACGSDAAGEKAPPLPKPKHAPATESGKAHSFDAERIAAGLNRPTYVGAAPGDPDALWVLEQPGRVVRLAEDGSRSVLLDMSDRVLTGAEQGLLGMAFHPDFATTRRLFLHWSDPAGDTRVAEFRAREDGTIAPEPVRRLLALDQPEENHNGGQLAFGPDGRLYLGLGDGGGAFDPRQTAQDRGRLLGKIVSADVDAAEPRWRVALYGLRNPWRFSFDPALGEIWVADVGQDEIEEVNRLLIESDEPPKNLGWSVFEGDAKVRRDHQLDGTGEIVWPVATYTHRDGCSVTGGFVYRGTDVPELAGRYVYGDFCTGAIWSLRPAPHGRAEDVRRERATVPQLTHIGQDSEGRMTFASSTGAVYRATPTP